jgi:hypothetical protein
LELALPHCSADDFDGEIVAINLDTGIYYSVRESAALIWHDLVDGHSVESLLALVQDNAEMHTAVARYIDDLAASGLLRPANNLPDPKGPPSFVAALPGMTVPALEPFGDMQDLLLLDPVHEVDEQAGWPKAPE